MYSVNWSGTNDAIHVHIKGYFGPDQAQRLSEEVRCELRTREYERCDFVVELESPWEFSKIALGSMIELRDLCAFAGCQRILLKIDSKLCAFEPKNLLRQNDQAA